MKTELGDIIDVHGDRGGDVVLAVADAERNEILSFCMTQGEADELSLRIRVAVMHAAELKAAANA